MRLEMLNPPYLGVDAERLAKWQPPNVEDGFEPLHTVRLMLRHHPELAEAMRPLAWFFLDESKSSLEVRVREVAVNRTLARCHCEYQWGIHQAVFGEAAGFTPEQRVSVVTGSPADPVWDERDRVLLRAVDELVDTSTLSDGLWAELRAYLSPQQMIELLVVVGWYQLNSDFTNATEVALESFAMRFPAETRPSAEGAEKERNAS